MRTFFNGTGSLEGLECHEIAFYFLMKPRGSQELNSNSYSQGGREYMHWLPIEKLGDYLAFPSFFAEKLACIIDNVEHIVTYESV